MTGGDFEGLTIEELCEWVNSLALCDFEILDEGIYGKSVKTKGNKKATITLELSRFNEDVPLHGGWACVSLNAVDERNGYSGWGAAYGTFEELERAIRHSVEKLGIELYQTRLF